MENFGPGKMTNFFKFSSEPNIIQDQIFPGPKFPGTKFSQDQNFPGPKFLSSGERTKSVGARNRTKSLHGTRIPRVLISLCFLSYWHLESDQIFPQDQISPKNSKQINNSLDSEAYFFQQLRKVTPENEDLDAWAPECTKIHVLEMADTNFSRRIRIRRQKLWFMECLTTLAIFLFYFFRVGG